MRNNPVITVCDAPPHLEFLLLCTCRNDCTEGNPSCTRYRANRRQPYQVQQWETSTDYSIEMRRHIEETNKLIEIGIKRERSQHEQQSDIEWEQEMIERNKRLNAGKANG